MREICVITGGGSGMGLAAAKEVGKTGKHIILVGRTVSKLEGAVAELESLGISAEAYGGDVSNAESMKAAAAYAAGQGVIKAVIHCAGVSPQMTDYVSVLEIDALGTVYVDQAFAPLMGEESCILNVSSMSAYMSPYTVYDFYSLVFTDIEAFKAGFLKLFEAVPQEYRAGMAYAQSKQFCIWYSKRMAIKYGRRGVRVVSISPGHFHTPMENYEGKEGQGTQMARAGALGRVGEAYEIGRMMAFMVSPQASYLCGVDLLYDGGTVAAVDAKKEDEKCQ